MSCIERQHRPNPEPVFTPLSDCGAPRSTTTYPRLNQRGTLVSRKYSTLIHFVPSEFPPSGEYTALKLTDGPHGFRSLLFTLNVFPEPQPELLVQGGVLRHSTPARRCNQVLVSAQGNIFHDHLFNRRFTRTFKCRQRTPGPVSEEAVGLCAVRQRAFEADPHTVGELPAGIPQQGVNLTRENASVVLLMRCPMG